jgi:hypothetical protein
MGLSGVDHYPDEKITDQVIDIQVKKGLKKKDFFFDKVHKLNKELLETDNQKINDRVGAIKPFEGIYK